MSLQIYKHDKFVQRLIDKEIITDAQLRYALELRNTLYEGQDLVSILVQLGHLGIEDVCRDLAERFDLQFIPLSDCSPPPELAARVPSRVARFFRVVPVEEKEGAIVLATDDPTNLTIFEKLVKIVGAPVLPAVATPDDVSEALRRIYPPEP